MMYISNSFSLAMLRELAGMEVQITPISFESAQLKLQTTCYRSVVGHSDTAQILSKLLNCNIVCNRESIQLQLDDELVVAQYAGARLPEGTTELPPGATFSWWLIKIRVDEEKRSNMAQDYKQRNKYDYIDNFPTWQHD
jgi:hypothetical protein